MVTVAGHTSRVTAALESPLPAETPLPRQIESSLPVYSPAKSTRFSPHERANQDECEPESTASRRWLRCPPPPDLPGPSKTWFLELLEELGIECRVPETIAQTIVDSLQSDSARAEAQRQKRIAATQQRIAALHGRMDQLLATLSASQQPWNRPLPAETPLPISAIS